MSFYKALIDKLVSDFAKKSKTRSTIITASQKISGEKVLFAEKYKRIEETPAIKESPMSKSNLDTHMTQSLFFEVLEEEHKKYESLQKKLGQRLLCLKEDFYAIMQTVNDFLYSVKEDSAQKAKSFGADSYAKAFGMTSKARKASFLVELQLKRYFEDLESDLHAITSTLNKFYGYG